jgi:DNA-binding response OmpR family regulator
MFAVNCVDAEEDSLIMTCPPVRERALGVRTIMVVDDDRSTREMLSLLLETEGFRVQAAGNGLRLLSTLHVDRPDAIVLDVRMSWIDGIALCTALKRNHAFAHIPVILISGCGDPGQRARGRDAGADDYFVKPLDGSRLVARLREAFEHVDTH